MRVIKISVKPQENRLDKFLAKSVKNLTRSKIKKLIKEGLILVGDNNVNPDYEVKKGDAIRIEIPPPKPTEVKPEKMDLKIVHEDKSVLVIDKDAGVVVHPTLDHPSGTLVNALLYHLKRIPSAEETLRPGIIHRLDRGTSGLLVVAKTVKALENLKKQFKERKVVKKYLALVSRKIEPPFGRIEKPISRHPKNRQKFTVSPPAGEGKEAITEYNSLKNFGNSFSLVEVQPKTGRTHQIRVHLSNMGHPILGDKLYGGKSAPRLFLHASYLEFTHPEIGKKVSFKSELPAELVKILDKIKRFG